ncbi:hypothetical protein A2U01_0063587, partial [Trifolium medium]|nr:hypothetical protein [Trifolium medium]
MTIIAAKTEEEKWSLPEHNLGGRTPLKQKFHQGKSHHGATDSIKRKNKEPESSEEENDKGKRPFVALVNRGFFRKVMESSSEDEESKNET